MARINIQETLLERLDPPTSVAGQGAAAAWVTRIWAAEHTDLAARSLVAVVRIEVLWGKSLDDVVRSLDAERVAADKRLAEEAARIDAAKRAVTP